MQLTEEQIQAVVDWMNEWEQLRDSAIPIRFKEAFSMCRPPSKAAIVSVESSTDIPITPIQKRTCPYCRGRGSLSYHISGGFKRTCFYCDGERKV